MTDRDIDRQRADVQKQRRERAQKRGRHLAPNGPRGTFPRDRVFQPRAIQGVAKVHTCHLCALDIAVGEPAVILAGVEGGEFYRAYLHERCADWVEPH